jgi:phytoene dehydrogenase-like protein
VIVVGGGHNGLLCAAYLARAGVDTLVLEARPTAGGCASTVEGFGARFNVCHCTHSLIRTLPLVDELDLDDHGLSYLSTDADSVFSFHDGRDPWVLFHDAERTIEGLAATHPGSVAGYRRYLADSLPVADLLLDTLRTPPTAPRLAAVALRRRARGLGRLLRWSRASASEILGHYFDDWRLVMPAVGMGPTVWGLAPETPGTGLAALAYSIRHRVESGRPTGGSGALVDAIRGSFEAAGGRIQCGTRVESLLVNDGLVDGVVLSDGVRLRAGTVVAACDPSDVFVRWLRDDLPPSASRLVRQWQRRSPPMGYQSKVDAVLSGIPVPAVAGGLREHIPGFDPVGHTMVVSPTPDELIQAHQRRAHGRVADRPTLLIDVPSLVDPMMSPPADRQVLSLEVLFTPYNHPGGWSSSTEPDRWLDLWAEQMVPGARDLVLEWRVMTPDRYETEFSMHQGHAPAWAGSPLDAFLGRSPELTRYRTPITRSLPHGGWDLPRCGNHRGGGT